MTTQTEQLEYHVAKWDEWSQAARETLLRLPPLEAERDKLLEVNKMLMGALQDLESAVRSRGVISTVKALVKTDKAIKLAGEIK